MGTATLNVWVRDKDFPCKPDMRWVWSVDVFVCDGNPLEWCGTRYYGAHKTYHGHVEIRVPPGCYIVRARTGSKGHHNLFTHVTMVIIGCNETACVYLVPPGAWTCGVQFNMAMEFQAKILYLYLPLILVYKIGWKGKSRNRLALPLTFKSAFDVGGRVMEIGAEAQIEGGKIKGNLSSPMGKFPCYQGFPMLLFFLLFKKTLFVAKQ